MLCWKCCGKENALECARNASPKSYGKIMISWVGKVSFVDKS